MRRKITMGLIALAILIGTLLLIRHITLTTVTLDVDGETMRHQTRADTVQAVLDDAGIVVATGDSVWPDPSTSLENGMTIRVQKAHAVTLDVDGETRSIRTQANHPLDILAAQSIALGDHDLLRINGQAFAIEQLVKQTWETPPAGISVIRSATITVVDESKTQVIHTTQIDLGRALDSAGIQLFRADRVIPDLNAPVVDEMTVRIERAIPIIIIADGHQIKTRALSRTVGDALAVIGVAPLGLDYTIPDLDTPLKPEMVIQVVRVAEKTPTQNKIIPPDSESDQTHD